MIQWQLQHQKAQPSAGESCDPWSSLLLSRQLHNETSPGLLSWPSLSRLLFAGHCLCNLGDQPPESCVSASQTHEVCQPRVSLGASPLLPGGNVTNLRKL